MTALLVAAAPLLVVVGLWGTSLSGDGGRVAADTGRDPFVAAQGPAGRPAPVVRGTPAAARPAGGVRPSSVVVPSLGVRADVVPITTVDGVLTPPDDPRSVGWWSDGSRPGARAGAAVITGHTVHTGGGAFDELEDLGAGDRVLVRSQRGTVAYDVARVEVLSRAELARDSTAIFARSGPGRLVLITCEDWDGTAYRSNVVVTARPVGA